MKCFYCDRPGFSFVSRNLTKCNKFKIRLFCVIHKVLLELSHYPVILKYPVYV